MIFGCQSTKFKISTYWLLRCFLIVVLRYPLFRRTNLIYDNSVYGIKIAPGEGKKPIPIPLDTYAEELSFPSVYCGLKREFKALIRTLV